MNIRTIGELPLEPTASALEILLPMLAYWWGKGKEIKVIVQKNEIIFWNTEGRTLTRPQRVRLLKALLVHEHWVIEAGMGQTLQEGYRLNCLGGQS